MLAVAGSINIDLVARVPHIPAPGQTLLGHDLRHHHGGKGANQAVAAARAGARVAFFGAVGEDAYGAELLQGLREAGVDSAGVQRVPGPSGCALIQVADAGENSVVVLPGANARAPLPAPGWRGPLLLLQLEVPMATTLAWALAARNAGATVLLNAAPFAPLPVALLQALDVLIVNQSERAALDAQAQGDAAVQQALAQLPWLVTTLGGEGVHARSRDGATLHLPAQPVVVVDSTGAGDCFCGVLAAGVLAQQPMALALETANRAAAQACTVAGARG